MKHFTLIKELQSEASIPLTAMTQTKAEIEFGTF